MSTQRYYPTPHHEAYFPYSSSYDSATTQYWTYDVFLSFRGEDTRQGFTDHLYAALNRKGIFTFRDNEELERGQSISPKLLKAIEESRFVIVILSTNYANSTWCLDELAKSVECMKMGQTILPVFHSVDPSDVRKQTGSFEKAFLKHEETFKDKKEKVQSWRDALFAVANLAGWHLKDGPESEVVEDIVGMSFTRLNRTILSESKDLVAMDSRIEEVLSFLEIGLPDVRIIGIWGMKGIGKTTLARVVAKRIRALFEGYSYLANVREATEKQGLEHLQEQLLADLLKSTVKIQNIDIEDVIGHRLHNKKALIIVDDVDEVEQVEALCDRTWFGPGSRIIITSTDEHVLSRCADKIYQVKLLTNDEALQLFSWKSFQKHQVEESFLKLSEDFLTYAKGLPLAIKVLGSFLCNRPQNKWSSALDRLKENPEKKIIDVLKVSFDGLSLETEKKVFLDIACFFKGENKDRVIRILETSCGYRPEIDIDVLVEKSLVTLFGRNLWMHDLIQELGWEIVRRECRERPGERSRLWLSKDIIPVLANNKGTTAVESILLKLPKKEEVLAPKNKKEVNLNVNAFSKMENLRLLKIWNGNFHGNIEYLSNVLQFLEWHECPLNSLPPNFESDKLVELNLYSSRIEQLWKGEKCWSMLQFIDLRDSQYLIMTPNFKEVPNLETLVLQGCTRLVAVHPSIGLLKKLTLLNMRYCKSVESLPPFISLESLKSLTLSGCSSLKKFPDNEGNMESLLELNLDGTAIEELPPSIGHLTGLTCLNLGDCKDLLCLPSSIQYLRSLKSFILAGCSKLDGIPENLNWFEFLEMLDLSGTALSQTSSFAGLSSLKDLNLSDCNLIEGALLNGLASLYSLEILNLSGNKFVQLPESFSQLSKLKHLDVSNCGKLQLMPKELPLSLQHVSAQDCTSLIDSPNKFEIWASPFSGTTTFNCFNSSQNQEHSTLNYLKLWTPSSSVLGGAAFSLLISDEREEQSLLDHFPMPTEILRKDFELLDYRSRSIQAVCNLEGIIPEWFNHTVSGNYIELQLSQDLKDDRNWMGVALCVAFSVEGTHESEVALELMNQIDSNSKTFYLYHCTLGTEEFAMEPDLFASAQLFRKFIKFKPRLFCVVYVPCLHISEMLNKSGVLWASFRSATPCVKVQKCGIRLLQKQDVPGFIETFMQYFDGSKCNLNKDYAAALESGWFKLVDKFLRWGRSAPTSEESSVILLRKNNVQTLIEETHKCQFYYFYLSGIPAWFHPEVGSCLSIKLPENLHKNKKWMGFALCASLAVDRRKLKQPFSFSCHLQINKFFVEVATIVNRTGLSNGISDYKDGLVIAYIPWTQFPEHYFMGASPTSMICTLFRTDTPGIEVQICGFRILYQQDLQGFVETVTHCMSRTSDTLFEIYDHYVVKHRLNLPLQSPVSVYIEAMTKWETYEEGSIILLIRNLESLLRRYFQGLKHACQPYQFFLSGTPEWLGSSVSIELPPNLHKCKKWMGFALCVSLAVDRNELREACYHFTCRFRMEDIDTELNIDLSSSESYDSQLWVIYIPRAQFPEQFTHSSRIRTTFVQSPGAELKMYGFRVLYQKDLEGFVQTIIQCILRGPEILVGYYNNLVVADWLGLVRSQSSKVDYPMKS